MQGAILDQTGLFISRQLLKDGFVLSNSAISAIYERMTQTYGIFAQRQNIYGANILTGNNAIFHDGIGSWYGNVTYDSSQFGMNISDQGGGSAAIDGINLSLGQYTVYIKIKSGSISSANILYGGTPHNFTPICVLDDIWIGTTTLTSGDATNSTLEMLGAVTDVLIDSVLLIKQAPLSILTEEGLCSISDSHHVSVKAFEAILKDTDEMVKSIQVLTDQILDLTGKADGTWKITAEAIDTYYEDGTISLTNGSANVTGSGTLFTQHFSKMMSLVILDSVSGNNGVYQISNVINDTSLTLKTNYTGTTETDLKFSAGGVFPDQAVQPTATANYRVLAFGTYQFVITQSAVGLNQIYLADVIISGGNIASVIDRRAIFKLKPHLHSLADISDFIIVAGMIGLGALDPNMLWLNSSKQIAVKPGGINYAQLAAQSVQGRTLHPNCFDGLTIAMTDPDVGAGIPPGGVTGTEIANEVIEPQHLSPIVSNKIYGAINTYSGGNVTGYVARIILENGQYGAFQIWKIYAMMQTASDNVVHAFEATFMVGSTVSYFKITENFDVDNLFTLNVSSGNLVLTMSSLQAISTWAAQRVS
jgi:hypothetical protein